jgi:hypothetical protein
MRAAYLATTNYKYQEEMTTNDLAYKVLRLEGCVFVGHLKMPVVLFESGSPLAKYQPLMLLLAYFAATAVFLGRRTA